MRTRKFVWAGILLSASISFNALATSAIKKVPPPEPERTIIEQIIDALSGWPAQS